MKRKKNNKVTQKPDEVLISGPLTMARFGSTIVSKNVWQPREFEKHQELLAENYAGVVQEIDRSIAEVTALVSTLNPLTILHRAWQERSASYLPIDSEVAVQQEQVLAARILDYVQSLVASTEPAIQQADMPSDKDWANLNRLVESIFFELIPQYFMCAAAKRRRSESAVDPAFEEFHFRTQLYWCNVTGEQYQVHQVQALRELLAPQSETIFQLYGLSSEQLCDELAKIWHSLTNSVSRPCLGAPTSGIRYC
ncbi:hypothetical protein [Nitrosomonas communis]|uniref:Uncharacterized protein n=1 Tax=Nitrosomonas communis TaxID=44574 RepID=A0A1I4LVF1_9PROT|nr:hypothetical protein [Nitrosomonas communis]SFL94951.1 hypothetical protein SAMN05421863_1007113 [Nitrosomonas communis]